MPWLVFIGCAAVVVLAAVKLAEYGDALATRTGLGGMFVGTLLLAGATSLPELLSAINGLHLGAPNLAVGTLFGSNMFNMFMLAFVDLLAGRVRVLRRVAMNHALTAGLAILLTLMAMFAPLARLDLHIGWVGLESLAIIGVYLAAVWLLRRSGPAQVAAATPEELVGVPSLLHAGLGFAVASAALVAVMPWLVRSAQQIAALTGLTTGFVGTTLLAIVTSLPELVASVTAIRLGAYDLTVGNLFGSNLFNMFALGLADVFYTRGRFLQEIDPAFAPILTCLGLIGNITQLRRRLFFIEADALAILVVYVLGVWLLYSKGIGA